MNKHDDALASLAAWQEIIQFDTALHSYFVGGKRLDSVTTIIGALAKPALIGWAAKEQRHADLRELADAPPLPDEEWKDYILRQSRDLTAPGAFRDVADDAADRGSRLHSASETQMRRAMGLPAPEFVPQNKLETAAVENLRAAYDEAGVSPLAVEQRIVIEELSVAGTFDMLAYRGGRLALVDIKTGKPYRYDRPYHEVWMQTAVYTEALHRLGFPIEERWVLHINRSSGAVRWYKLDEPYEEAFRVFASLAPVQRWMRETRGSTTI